MSSSKTKTKILKEQALPTKGGLPNATTPSSTNDANPSGNSSNGNGIMDDIQPMPSEPNNPSLPSIPGAFRTGGLPVGHDIEAPTATTTTSAATSTNGSSPAPPETAPSHHHQGLVEALPVCEEDDPAGQQEHLEEARPIEKKKTPNGTGGGSSRFGAFHMLLVLGTLIFLAVCVGVLISVVSSSSSSTDDSKSSSAAQLEDEAVSLSLTSEERILSLLPNLTKTSIFVEDSHDDEPTPQALAFEWLLQDPNVESYESQRLLQRFVLATIFFATGGEDHWLRTDHWLDYGVHECHWYHSPECFHYCVCPDEFDPCDNGDNTTYTQMSIVANNLRGKLPPEIFLLDTLREFTLMGNTQLEGGIPTDLIHHATSLELLWVSRNSLTGTIPIHNLLQLKNLTHLRLCCNEFSGTIPTELGLFSARNNLKDLILDTNQLTGTVPTQLGLLGGSLTDLRLQVNPQLEGTLPTQFAALTDLTRLRLSDLPLLSGSIPPMWYQSMTSLKEFTMEGNIGLEGVAIPSEIGLWQALQKLTIGGNHNMTAEVIPTQVGLLVDLKKLVMKNNNLIGRIPSQLGLLQNLTDISLQENHLTGSIPSQLIQATALVNLELNFNDLTGEIPPFGGVDSLLSNDSTPTMVLFNASHNPLLVGTIPLSVCGINFTDFDCRVDGDSSVGEEQQNHSSGGLCGCDCLCGE